MSVTAERVAVTAAATALNTAGSAGRNLTLFTADADVSIGPSDVTTSTGLVLPTSQLVTIEVDSGDVLYAIHATTATVQVLRT